MRYDLYAWAAPRDLSAEDAADRIDRWEAGGGNLAEALSNLSTVLRARKMMGEKIKALSSEATASAGIIGSLPPAVMILVSLTTPAYMAKLFTDPRGQFMLLVAVVMMAFGVFVMKKMISFKF